MKRLPNATYRVQLNSGFRFSDLEENLPYFKKLGVSHLYLSPIMEAAKGSTHFYNTFDFTSISSVLGGEGAFISMAEKFRKEGIGLIVDIVPNHMTILNKFMLDYLKNGPDSPFINLFDMDLESNEGRGKIVLPFLDFYPFEEPERFSISNACLKIDGTDFVLPVRGGTEKPGDKTRILSNQHYLLTHWRESSRIINYRRFFAVNDLIAIRMERKENFELFHSKIRDLLNRDLIQGLRIDHIDGLNDPLTYLKRLRRLSGNRPIWVEKILARNEELREEWPVEGETGYSARSRINSVFLDSRDLDRIRDVFRDFGGGKYEGEEYRAKLKIEISRKLFQSDFDKYSRLIQKILISKNLVGISVTGLSEALQATIACFNRYRTYSSVDQSEIEIWKGAVEKAVKLFPFLKHELSCFKRFLNLSKDDRKSAHVLQRIEQFTGAVMAKSMEDCYFYRYSALLSTCLVGSMPFEKPYSDSEIHAFFEKIQSGRNRPMITLSTHDTKFGEDAVARFNAIADLHEEWKNFLSAFPVTSEIKEYDIYRILQVILGTYDRSQENYVKRLENYIIKALRESGENTNWEFPSSEYEEKCVKFARDAIVKIENKWPDLLHKIQYLGGLTSLSQTVLKFMAPGIPDTYQGSESMNFSFVDPDNRRPVSFMHLSGILQKVTKNPPGIGRENVTNGNLKVFIVSRLIAVRSEFSELFFRGRYFPLQFSGKKSDNIFGFYYVFRKKILIIIITRHHKFFFYEDVHKTSLWKGTSIIDLPVLKGKIKDRITGRLYDQFDLHAILMQYPFAVLEATIDENI